MEDILGKALLFLPKRLSNKDVFESEDIVRSYSDDRSLQKPEETILRVLQNKTRSMKMLDIGVGAGRTTRFFAPLMSEYLGIDYAENMIKICRQKYPGSEGALSFEVANATAMDFIEDGHFDFVLFSFNGIDYMNHEDRLKILKEVHRVTREGGYFCFSTHNLNSAPKLSTFHWSKNPFKLLKETGQLVLFRLINKETWKALRNTQKNQQYMILNNGAHNFRTTTYYVTPDEQTKQLTNSGFSDIRIYGLMDGKQIKNPAHLQNTTDDWLYYMCIAN